MNRNGNFPALNTTTFFVLFSLWLGLAAGADPIPLPHPSIWTPGTIDEPQGPYYSCGLTLTHLGRNREAIRKFHTYLAAQNLNPTQLPRTNLPAIPDQTTKIVLDPEKLTAGQLPAWGWQPAGTALRGEPADEGPDVRIPLTLAHAGTYLIGIRYHGSTQHTGLTGLRIYPRTQASAGPLVADEFYNKPAPTNGWIWHELMVTLPAGDYDLLLSPKTRSWHAPANIGYGPRQIDCLYLTDGLWQDLPDETALNAIRQQGQGSGIQTTLKTPMTPSDRLAWTQWQVRPLSWDDAVGNPRLFGLSYLFWQKLVSTYAADTNSNSADYRTPNRQIIFDDVWNMVGNPWRIAEQIKALSSDLSPTVKPGRHYLKNAGRVDERLGGSQCDWWPQADKVVSGTPYNFQGELRYSQNVEPGYTYALWAQFRDIGFFEPWQLWASWPGDPTNELHWKRVARNYPPDIDPQRTWVKMGDIVVPANSTNNVIRWRVADLPWNGLYAVSYRWIHNFLLTSDPTFKPKGTVMPPASLADYLEKAGRLGGKTEEGILCQTANDRPLPLDWWPGPLQSLNHALHMPPDAFQSFQIGMRGVADEPVAVGVTCEPLQGGGKTYPGRITWRVPAYVPYGTSRSTWTTWCLLRRPFVTVPQYNVAGIYLQVDTRGVKPGDYKARIVLTPHGRISRTRYPTREAVVTVKVSPVGIAPKTPVLVHGYTMPPEGEAYLQDYQAHGLKVWCGPILSKTEMRRRGMLMQQLRARASNGNYSGLMDSIKAAGLGPKDYYVIVWDEPSGTTEADLLQFIGTAKRLHELDPSIPRVFNPGEPAVLKTFQLLDPFCEIWMPYDRHFYYHPNEAAAKTAIITSKPWMDYTTPCYEDKEAKTAEALYGQIRRVPAARGNCLGTWFFALYYPFRDPWDTANEYLRDTSVFVLPSDHGPVATFSWEKVRLAIQTADLAMMVKERAASDDAEAQSLIGNGSMGQLLVWLENHGGSPSKKP